MEHQWFIASYTALFIVNFLLFGMQRTALLIDREFEPSYVRAVLPQWLAFSRLFFLGKVFILGILFYQGIWLLAISLIVCDFILGMILPIPYKIYEKPLRKRAEILFKLKNHEQPLQAINNSKYFK